MYVGPGTRLIVCNRHSYTEPIRSKNKKTAEQIKIWKNRFLTIRWTKLNLSQKQQMHLLKLIKTRLFYNEHFFLWTIFNKIIAKKPLKSSKIVVFLLLLYRIWLYTKMLNVKVIDNIKTKLFPIGHFFVRSIPDELNKRKQFLTPKCT